MNKIKTNLKTIFIILILSLFYFPLLSCSFFFGEEAELSYESMFENLWKDYNETYALFEVRNVDWKKQGEFCRSQISSSMTDKEFLEVLKQLLYPLKDAHVYAKTPFGSINSGEDQVVPDNFSLNEVCSQYIESPKKNRRYLGKFR